MALPASSGTGPEPTYTAGAFPGDGGVIRLHTGQDDYVRVDPAGAATGTPQPLSATRCELSAPLPSALTFAATGRSSVGFIQDAIGLRARGEGQGTSCGQVNGSGEALVVSTPGKAMDFAELDIEGKFGATVVAALYRGTELVTTQTLASGGPDSGPDSSDGDNFRWRVGTPVGSTATVYFDQIRLSVSPSTPDGAFSLEGGADGTAPEPGGLGSTLATSDSLFHYVSIDGFLTCGGAPTVEGDGTSVPMASIRLLASEGCESLPYNLEVGVDGNGWNTVTFEKAADGDERFSATLTWTPEEAAYPVSPTKIDYGLGDGPHLLQWCSVDGNGTPTAPEGEPWCLTSHTSTLLPSGEMQVVETLLGSGDPFSFR